MKRRPKFDIIIIMIKRSSFRQCASCSNWLFSCRSWQVTGYWWMPWAWVFVSPSLPSWGFHLSKSRLFYSWDCWSTMYFGYSFPPTSSTQTSWLEWQLDLQTIQSESWPRSFTWLPLQEVKNLLSYLCLENSYSLPWTTLVTFQCLVWEMSWVFIISFLLMTQQQIIL